MRLKNFFKLIAAAALLCAALQALAGGILPVNFAAPSLALKAEAKPLSAGQNAVFCTLKGIDNKTYSFPAQKNWNMVFFWSLFCGSCLEEMPVMQDRLKNQDAQGLNAFFVSIDTERMKTGLINFAKTRGFSHPILLEQIASGAFEAADKWGVTTTPSVFLSDPNGRIFFSHTGPIDVEELFNIYNNYKQKFADGENHE